jgi:hypothetical protein
VSDRLGAAVGEHQARCLGTSRQVAAQSHGRSPGAQAHDLVTGAGRPDAIDDPPQRDRVTGEAQQPARRAAHGIDLAASDRQVIEAGEQVARRPVQSHLVAGHHRAPGIIVPGEAVEQRAESTGRSVERQVPARDSDIATQQWAPPWHGPMDQ